MSKRLTLILKSKGRNDKEIRIISNYKEENESVLVTHIVKNDILGELKDILEAKDMSLSDFVDFVALKTDSFTGYRESVTICNILKHYVLNTAIKGLTFPKYHKEPNITLPRK